VSSHLVHRSDAPAGGPIDQRLIAPLRDLGDNDFRQLIRMFLDEAAGRVARLQAIQQQGATHELAGVSHALKGTSAAFGATRLSALCAEIEEVAIAPASVDLAMLVKAVVVEFERVRAALTEELS
jgi:two-component system sensor histidine kinase/response regulator